MTFGDDMWCAMNLHGNAGHDKNKCFHLVQHKANELTN